MIDTQTFILIELFLVFGGLLAFLFWQMHALKKARQAREARERLADEQSGHDQTSGNRAERRPFRS